MFGPSDVRTHNRNVYDTPTFAITFIIITWLHAQMFEPKSSQITTQQYEVNGYIIFSFFFSF